MVQISDVHHVSLIVGDLAVAEAFYVDVLGLERLPRPDFGIEGAWLGAGDRQVHLVVLGDAPEDKGQHFAFRVDDLDAAIAHLTEHGITTSDVFDTPVGRQVAFHDPFGNGLELNQPND